MKSDIEIAQQAKIIPINIIAENIGISNEYIENYGHYKAKIDYNIFKNLENKKDANLILVTAINPTPAGEGKTTTSIGLCDSLNKIGCKSIVALREPSLGPVFGIKGGAAGGGYSQVIPMEDINLHFTGDIHAIGAANNLIAAMLDNHIHQGNKLDIDVRKVLWKRCIDMNDRQLRNIVGGLGGKANGVPREDGFDITVASEIMAILCLSENITELKNELNKIVLAYNREGRPVTVGDINAQGAAAALLKDALKPNLVQTLEHNPAFIHGGPFANIAHGCSSLIATKMALKLSDYTVTEAGFGADLGAEKFFNIKCRHGNLKPSVVVIVATIRALKYNGGALKNELNKENIKALEKGIPNLLKHIENITEKFNLPTVVTLNKFPNDTDAEIETVKKACSDKGVECVLSEVWSKGSSGGVELAQKVVDICKKSNNFNYLYDSKLSVKEKITKVAKEIYGAKDLIFSKKANKEISSIENMGYGNLPVCIAKTQYSLSDDPSKIGRPEGFTITINDIKLSAGAGFITVYTGSILTMPGLPNKPSAENIDVDNNGKIRGLF